MYKDENSLLFNGDCIPVMEELIKRGIKVDAIITDIPYQITTCSWDTLIPFNNHVMLPKTKRSKKLVPVYRDEYILRELKEGREYEEICKYFDDNCKEGMWQKLNKLIKPNGAIVLFGKEPFSSALRMSNIKNFKQSLIWNKVNADNPMQSKRRHLNITEDICIFYKSQCTFNPQGLIKIQREKSSKQGKMVNSNITKNSKYVQKYTNYPKNIVKFNIAKKYIHPTQKPLALMEYLVKTYTNENEVVLDFTMGSCSTGVACRNTNRKFIGIELDKGYYDIAVNRIKESDNND